MQRDVKLGLALAVLLVGSVTAFFFRKDTDPHGGLPRLQDVERIDGELAGRAVAPYLDHPRPEPAASPRIDESDWAKPAFLGGSNVVASTVSHATLSHTAVTPDPIPLNPDLPAMGNDRPSVIGQVEQESRDEGRMFQEDVVMPAMVVPQRAIEPAPPVGPATVPPPVLGGQVSRPVQTHVVQPGETLSGLAKRYLGSVARYGEIFEANRDRLRDPHDLRIGQALVIPTADPPLSAVPALTTAPAVTVSPPVPTPTPEPEEIPAVDAAPSPRDAVSIGPALEPVSPSETRGSSTPLFQPAPRRPFLPSRFRSTRE